MGPCLAIVEVQGIALIMGPFFIVTFMLSAYPFLSSVSINHILHYELRDLGITSQDLYYKSVKGGRVASSDSEPGELICEVIQGIVCN